MSFGLIVQHTEPFGAGRILPALGDFGIPLQLRRLWAGDEIPADLDEVRLLVILGAGAKTSIADVPSPLTQLVQRAISADLPTLAIGFGAQVLAHAAGAKVYPNGKPGAKPEDPITPMPDFGWHPVNFPFPGGTEPIVFGMIDGAPMFHWHTDTLDLPKLPANPVAPPPGAPPAPTGNVLLSSSRNCRNEAFRFKNRLFGFQFHFELTNEEFEMIFDSERDTIAKQLGAEGSRKLREDTQKSYSRYSRLGNRLINNFVQYLKTY